MSLGRRRQRGAGEQAVASARRRNSKGQEKEKEKESRFLIRQCELLGAGHYHLGEHVNF